MFWKGFGFLTLRLKNSLSIPLPEKLAAIIEPDIFGKYIAPLDVFVILGEGIFFTSEGVQKEVTTADIISYWTNEVAPWGLWYVGINVYVYDSAALTPNDVIYIASSFSVDLTTASNDNSIYLDPKTILTRSTELLK